MPLPTGYQTPIVPNVVTGSQVQPAPTDFISTIQQRIPQTAQMSPLQIAGQFHDGLTGKTPGAFLDTFKQAFPEYKDTDSVKLANSLLGKFNDMASKGELSSGNDQQDLQEQKGDFSAPKSGFGKFIQNLVSPISNTITELAQTVGAHEDGNKFNQAIQTHTQQMSTLFDQLKEAQAKGEDTTAIKAQIQDNLKTTPKIQDYFDQSTLKRMNQDSGANLEEFVGNALGSAAFLVGGGEAEGVASSEGSLLAKAGKGAVSGAKVGALAGGSSAMAQGGDIGDVVKGITEGALGGGAIGGVTEPLISGASRAINGEDLNILPKSTKVTPPSEEEINLEMAKQGVSHAEAEATLTQKAVDEANTQKQQEIAQAQKEREAKAIPAVNARESIKESAETAKTSAWKELSGTAQSIEKENPELNQKIDVKPNGLYDQLTSLKGSKNFDLPDFIKNPKFVRDPVTGENIIKLTPTQSQELITELNRDLYKETSDGVKVKDQQRIDIANEIKKSAADTYGDAWTNAYAKYSTTRDAIDGISNLFDSGKKVTSGDANKTIENIQKLSSTPEGKAELKKSLYNFFKSTGIDLTEPISTVQQISDAEDKIASKISEAKETASEGKAKIKESASEIKARKSEVKKAQKAVDKIMKEKNMTTRQKIEKLTRQSGPMAVRFVIFRLIWKALSGI